MFRKALTASAGFIGGLAAAPFKKAWEMRTREGRRTEREKWHNRKEKVTGAVRSTSGLVGRVLNPDGNNGENNLFGDEETKYIIPAINKLKELQICTDGPVPADTALLENNTKKYDCIYYMYHDQALCAFKTIFFDIGVNLTLGLSIIRTSVDHGTAEELVGKKDKISIKSFLNALNIAEKFSH